MQSLLVSRIAILPVLKRIGDACDFRFLTLHPFYPASSIVIADSDKQVSIYHSGSYVLPLQSTRELLTTAKC